MLFDRIKIGSLKVTKIRVEGSEVFKYPKGTIVKVVERKSSSTKWDEIAEIVDISKKQTFQILVDDHGENVSNDEVYWDCEIDDFIFDVLLDKKRSNYV